MSDHEKDVLAMYSESMPVAVPPHDPTWINHVALTLLVVSLSLVVWLTMALVNAENMRNAYATRACPDPIFKGEADPKCLAFVKTRDHWWEHVWYAMGHLHPDLPSR